MPLEQDALLLTLFDKEVGWERAAAEMSAAEQYRLAAMPTSLIGRLADAVAPHEFEERVRRARRAAAAAAPGGGSPSRRPTKPPSPQRRASTSAEAAEARRASRVAAGNKPPSPQRRASRRQSQSQGVSLSLMW